MADMEETERSSGIVERLLFYALPILFTLLLTGVLLTVFGYDIKNVALKIGNSIPGLAAVLPDPEPTEEEQRQAAETSRENEQKAEAEDVEAAKTAAAAELEQKKAEVAALQADLQAKEQRIDELVAQLETVKEEQSLEAATEEEYAANIRALAKVYANMKSSKAAAIMENLTLSERVLLLREMKSDQQVDILEDMDPAVAAETSILMKDAVAVKDLQIAALQERLSLNEAKPVAASQLTREEVSRTFARMAPDRAAEVLLEMAIADEASVIDILRAMEEKARATILDTLTKLDKERTARITAKLS